jgi:hypothetical protein
MKWVCARMITSNREINASFSGGELNGSKSQASWRGAEVALFDSLRPA